MSKNNIINIAGHEIHPGNIVNIELPAADLYTQTKMNIPIHVFHGKEKGPAVFITSAIHGDELDSIEILRRLHFNEAIRNVKGTLITIPIVNIYGFILQSRYLPDRRDLNRSFPGSKAGSLAARLANILLEEIISKCQFGIDLHTGAYGRLNMPQLRVNLDVPGTSELAKAFDVPIILDAKLRDGSLRQSASELGIPLLVYEGGEALRYNELCIRLGVRGILNVLHHLKMIHLVKKNKRSAKYKPIVVQTSRWVRAKSSGLVQLLKKITARVKEGEKIALIHDPFLINPTQIVVAPFSGIIIGTNNLPLVNEGDAICHIASGEKLKNIDAYIDEISDEIIRYW